MLADFVNTTGDSVFDGTLKQALAIQLEQSPVLNVLSDRRLNATLKLMDRPADQRLTNEVAREVCLRSNSKALLGRLDRQRRKPLSDRAEGSELPNRRHPGQRAGGSHEPR